MKRLTKRKNTFLTLAILCLCFLLCLILNNIFTNSALIPAIFVLGVFMIALMTPGYVYGIASAFVSVLAFAGGMWYSIKISRIAYFVIKCERIF